MSAAGWVLAAGAVELANEAVFAPLEGQGTPWKDVNWRVVPATAVLALVLTGFEKMAPQFGNILGGLVLLGVLILPFGNAPTPIENISNVITGKG